MAASRARALRLAAPAARAELLEPEIVDMALPAPPPGHAVVEVLATAVNPSDAKAALGFMPQAVWPRTPGRDYAGRVVAGPAAWLGVEVWGTGGDLGITRDGAHARYLLLPLEALACKPAAVPMAAAGTVGVPFVTAYEGLRRAGLEGAGQTVAVFGASGKVGQAAMQLATRAGARAVGILRGMDARDAIGAAGADIAFNTVGSPWFAAALDTLAVGGTQVLIATIERSVPFDILPFYRRNLRMLGVDSLKLTAAECAAILETLRPGFEDGTLRAYDVDASRLLPLDEAPSAYRRVLAGATERVVLAP